MKWPSGAASRWPFLVILSALVVFAPALGGELLEWDDDINILDNPRVWSLTGDNLVWMFTDISQALRFKALSWLSWTLVYSVSGTSGVGYHAANLALHVANAALLYALITRLFGKLGGAVGDDARWPAFAGATFWALGPLRAEPIAWATGLPYCQATLFVRLSLRYHLDA